MTPDVTAPTEQPTPPHPVFGYMDCQVCGQPVRLLYWMNRCRHCGHSNDSTGVRRYRAGLGVSDAG